MSDHLFSIEFTSIACKGEGLAVDSCPIYIDECDATKVLLDADGNIKNIGKNLLNFNYFDTGFFILNESIFLHAKELAGIQRNISLSEIIKCSKIKTTNLTGKFWIDIDTSTDLSYARSWMTNQSLQS
jgi:CDP-L-myo-inositol myo-inositolphosphotransferase